MTPINNNQMSEESIKELDAIINLYKDDPADGLRNKIWAWHTTLISHERAEGKKEAYKDLILEYHEAELEGKGYDFYFAIRTKLDGSEEEYLSKESKDGK